VTTMAYTDTATVSRAGEPNPRDARTAHLPLERFVEHLTEVGCYTLLKWARREAPELLRALMKAFVSGNGFSNSRAADEEFAGAAAGSARLCDIEREHIRQVLAASKTVHEAAEILGIDDATLWRKRKRYNLD